MSKFLETWYAGMFGKQRKVIEGLTESYPRVVKAFMENSGRVMTRLQLIDTALGYSYEGFERTVDAHVKNLRQKVERDPGTPQQITTVYGVGYKFVEQSDGT